MRPLGSYVLSQKYKTIILASVLQISIYCTVLGWLHHEGFTGVVVIGMLVHRVEILKIH